MDDTTQSWRASDLPNFAGAYPDDPKVFLHKKQEGKNYEYTAPFKGHRWLPVKASERIKAMAHTPYGNAIPNPMVGDFWLNNWPLAAQNHYSFFENVERGHLYKYYFGDHKTGLQNTWFNHYSINMLSVYGSHVALVVRRLCVESFGHPNVLYSLSGIKPICPAQVTDKTRASSP